jgi:hypothetical protein
MSLAQTPAAQTCPAGQPVVPSARLDQPLVLTVGWQLWQGSAGLSAAGETDAALMVQPAAQLPDSQNRPAPHCASVVHGPQPPRMHTCPAVHWEVAVQNVQNPPTQAWDPAHGAVALHVV